MVRRIIGIFVLLQLISCESKRETYYETGELKDLVTLKSGKIHGEVIKYNRNGIMIEHSIWENDVRHGLSKTYFENGSVYLEMTFEQGVRNGEVIEYYKSGEIKEEASYKSGKILGDFRQFFKKGSIKRKGEYFEEGLKYREYYNSGEHKEYLYRAIHGEDSILYYKKYNKGGFIEEFALPIQVIRTESNYCIKLIHSFIPPDKLLLKFYSSRSSSFDKIKNTTRVFSAEGGELCIKADQLDGIMEGFVVETVKGRDMPMAYIKVALDEEKTVWQ